MAYRKITSGSELNNGQFSLGDFDTVRNELQDICDDINKAEMPIIVAPDSTHFSSLMEEKEEPNAGPPPSTKSLPPEDALAAIEKWIEKIKFPNKQNIIESAREIGLPEPTTNHFLNLATRARKVLLGRKFTHVHALYCAAQTDEEKLRIKNENPFCFREYTSLEELKEAGERMIRSGLEQINEAISHLSQDTTTPRILRQKAEAIYTMATADTPLTLTQALEATLKIDIPRRGDLGRSS